MQDTHLPSTLLVVRAVGVTFARRMLRIPMLAGSVLAVILLVCGGWLTTQSAWWWLLESVFIAAALIFALIVIIVRTVLGRVEPTLSRQQRKDVGAFVDKLERVAENVKTPYPMILFYVIRDAVRPRPDSFIETVSHDSRSLGPDFIALAKALSR